jgi:MFS family permease
MDSFKIVLIATFFFYFGWMMRQMLIPLYAKYCGASVSATGMIMSSMMLVTCFLAPVFGLFSDSLGRKRVICFGLLIRASTCRWLLSRLPRTFNLLELG